jgi:hypothetical protein
MFYQNLLQEIRILETRISNAENEIKSTDSKIEDTIKTIDNKYLSISIESVLLSLPNKAIGSKIYAQKLNTQAQLYQDSQFNKIIRFLSLVEEIENDYNESYCDIGKSYLTKPDKSNSETLISKYTLLKNEYSLMNVLIDAIKTDKVLFNKVYNILEDRGLFMSIYDKLNYHNLSSIASNMVTLVEQSYLMNENLISINNDLWENNNKLELISDSLGEIDASVKASNFLSTVQSYQLYKINKNTKRLNK